MIYRWSTIGADRSTTYCVHMDEDVNHMSNTHDAGVAWRGGEGVEGEGDQNEGEGEG